MMKKIGCYYHPKLPDEFGRRLATELLAATGVSDTWTASAWDDDAARDCVPGTDLLICIGGDGTVLRAARAVVPHNTLLLGVNLGRLGFLTELDARSAVERMPEIVAGAGRIEERAMLHAEVIAAAGGDGGQTPARQDALNDVVIGRATLGRTVQVAVSVDGEPMAEYRADGIIVATATGSTAYSLSTGGPVLPPESREILLTPLAPHLAPRNSVILPPSTTVEVQLAARQQATFSVDGERDLDLQGGDTVRVLLGPHRARFLRLSSPARFYQRLARRLNWLPDSDRRPADADAQAVAGQGAPA
ncbi:MAG: NAD(+)/NADH kinase [Chloroflexi bacterium]|nr:NAD(+)/NADH kinase [Chloroflexota bacterium]